MTITGTDKFWSNLKTSTRNSLLRAGYGPDSRDANGRQPWNCSVKHLIRIPGIGPQSIAEIAKLAERYCI